MNNTEIIAYIMDCKVKNIDVTLTELTDEYFRRNPSKANTWVFLSAEWSHKYESFRKRITRLTIKGLLEKVSDLGKGIIITLPTKKDFRIPSFIDLMNYMIKENPQWFSKKVGGTSKGGGYEWIMGKFYQSIDEYINN